MQQKILKFCKRIGMRRAKFRSQKYFRLKIIKPILFYLYLYIPGKNNLPKYVKITVMFTDWKSAEICLAVD